MVKFILKLNLDSALLVGGQAVSLLIDCSTASQASGKPIIPASALKGALRIEFERLAKSASGYDICNPSSDEAACGKKQETCMACSLFGAPGNEGKLRFYDALPAADLNSLFVKTDQERGDTPTGLGYGIRNGVAISRKRKAAEEKMLYNEETIAPFIPGLIFESVIISNQELTAEEYKYLCAAVTLLTAIGRGKSKGLGSVKASLHQCMKNEHDKEPDVTVSSNQHPVSLVLDLIPLENMVLGNIKAKDNFFDSLDYVPGSQVRGAIAGLFGKELRSEAGKNDFKNSFFHEPALFSDFYPTTESVPSKPIPLSLRTCKYLPGLKRDPGDESHGARDILISATLVKIMRDEGLNVALNDRCMVKDCHAPLKNIFGYYTTPLASIAKVMRVPGQVVTKTAINRKRWQSLEGKLYTYQLMDVNLELPENRRPHFMGIVSKVSPPLASFINNINNETLFLGAARSRGYGAVKIKVDSYDNLLAAIRPGQAVERMRRFSDVIVDALKKAGIDQLRGHMLEESRFFSITLTANMAIPPGDWQQYLLDQLLNKLNIDSDKLFLENWIAICDYRGGYSDLYGIRKDLVPVIKAGSVFVCSCFDNRWCSESQLEKKVEVLQREGLGNLREEGFGRLEFCDEVHLRRIEQE